MTGPRLLPLVTVLVATAAAGARGQDRLVRRLTSYGDIALGLVRSVAQDSVGFIWLGTDGGLLRWDGLELRRWAPEQIDNIVTYQSVCPDGTLHVVTEGGIVLAVTADGARAELELAAADGPLRNVRCDADNRLWAAAGSTVWRRDTGGEWREAAPGTFAGEAPFIIEGPPGPGVWVRTLGRLWRLEADGSARAVLDAPQPQAILFGAAGDTLLLTRGQGLLRLGPGVARRSTLVPALGRGIDMQHRGTTVWITFDRFLVALRPGEPHEVIGPEALPEGGGLMLIDREGSLWIGSFTGLVQFPEPETVYWHDRHGFPSAHTRFLARAGNRVWASTWQGLGYIEERGGRRTAHKLPDDWRTAMPPFVDSRNVLWAATPAGLREVAGDRTLRIRPFSSLHWDVEPAPGGGVWLASNTGLMHAPAGRRDVVPVPGSPFPPGVRVRQILRTREGHLWLAGDERICGTSAPTVTPRDGAWTCDSIAGAVEFWGLAELPSGAVWAASSRLGVWRRRDGRWESHPGNATLAARAVYGLRPSRDGGMWLLGTSDAPRRVRENLASPLGWEVLETLTAWHGVRPSGDVLEDPDGTLWLTTSMGVARVPPAVRRAALPFVRVALVEVAVDGVPVRGASGAPLRHRHNRLDVRFAALSYRDPAKIRYQVRLAPQQDWSDHVGPPAFRWIDLPAGTYRAEVRASLDGRTWSPEPASFAVVVRAPWYLQPWALALAVIAVVAVAYLAHRMRVAVLLRLERQRTRIALDLHDEMGSGLGSIGILSGVLASERLGPAERGRLTGKIAEIAAELGASLSNIIWSLRGRPGSLQDVAARLAEHGARLFAGDTRFDAQFPAEWPAAPLDFTVSRGVLLIGFEALYNAARHAGARVVTLTVALERRGWALTIEDDGRGLADTGPASSGSGLGRASMRDRAAEIGAELRWEAVAGGGTRVTLRWVPRRRSSRGRLA